MKTLKVIFISILFLGCQKTKNNFLTVGTWTICLKDGVYSEYKINENYILTMHEGSEEIWIFKNEINDSIMVLSNFKNGNSGLPYNDTLRTLSYSKHKIIIRSNYTREKFELNKADFIIDDIDSTNLELWKSKTLSEFKKRSVMANCPDLRTDDEKVIPSLENTEFKEDTVPIGLKRDSKLN
tara:strand:- start:53 stop:598 length:546 start_codon:yes stop_codon:yes gene_type:complete